MTPHTAINLQSEMEEAMKNCKTPKECAEKAAEVAEKYADIKAYELLDSFKGPSYEVDNAVFYALGDLFKKLKL